MIAYFVTDSNKDSDLILVPDLGSLFIVDSDRVREFIAPSPDFCRWNGQPCAGPNPEQFGTIVATRDDQGDVCVVDSDLWPQRLSRYL